MDKQKQYSIMDMQDAHELAASDLNWAWLALADLSTRFQNVKTSIQQSHDVHDCYFDDMRDFLQMYEYLIEVRHAAHKEQATRFEVEAKQQ